MLPFLLLATTLRCVPHGLLLSVVRTRSPVFSHLFSFVHANSHLIPSLYLSYSLWRLRPVFVLSRRSLECPDSFGDLLCSFLLLGISAHLPSPSYSGCHVMTWRAIHSTNQCYDVQAVLCASILCSSHVHPFKSLSSLHALATFPSRCLHLCVLVAESLGKALRDTYSLATGCFMEILQFAKQVQS